MDRSDFQARLQKASNFCVEYTRTMVSTTLPEQYLYLLKLNQSYDGNPLHKDEIVYPEDTLPRSEHLRPREASEVVDAVWRDGRVPEWINVIVKRATPEYTFLLLEACGRFTDNPKLLYYQNTDWPPFGAKGTFIPRNWRSVEEDGRFDLHWKENKC